MNNKTPNFYMIPGDPMKKLDTPSSFSYKAAQTMSNLGMADGMANSGHHTPANDGHSPVDFFDDKDKKDKAVKGAAKGVIKGSAEAISEGISPKKDISPKKNNYPKRKRTSLNPLNDEYTGIFEGSNPYIRIGSSQKSESGTIFE